jgi:hypothetical protein
MQMGSSTTTPSPSQAYSQTFQVLLVIPVLFIFVVTFFGLTGSRCSTIFVHIAPHESDDVPVFGLSVPKFDLSDTSRKDLHIPNLTRHT